MMLARREDLAGFESKLKKATDRMVKEVTEILDETDLDTESTGGASYIVSVQLRELVGRLLEAVATSSLTGNTFKETTAAVSRLLEHNPGDASVERIKRLMLSIAHPARLMELMDGCEPSRLEVPDGNAPRGMRSCSGGSAVLTPPNMRRPGNIWDALSNNHHIPDYILEKLTTHFAPGDTPGGDVHRSDLTAATMVEPSWRQKAKFLENLAEDERPTRHDFELVELLSAGAYGAVHMGRHKGTKERVAIKILKKKQMIDKNCTLFPVDTATVRCFPWTLPLVVVAVG